MFTHLKSRISKYVALLTVSISFKSYAVPIYNPLDYISWTPVKNYGGVTDIGSPHYLDVIAHTDPYDPVCPRSSGMNFAQASIRIHETQHMLHYQILRLGNMDPNLTGIYYQNGQGILFKKPNTKITEFTFRIPLELKEPPSPYQTYIVDQTKYPTLNNIGYLFDEWASYRSNIILNLELEKTGIPEPDRDSHAANYSPHFFGYLAIAMHHIRLREPNKLNDQQFKAAFALYAQESWRLMHEALKSPVFGKPDTIYGSRIQKLMDFYRNSPRFADVRNSLAIIYGQDWVTQLLQ